MLAIGSRRQYPPLSGGWFLFIVANASKESRQRLVRLLTCPNIQPLDIQYILGQDRWTYDMFDYFPQIDLDNPVSIGDHFSSYVGVAHAPDSSGNGCYLYNGSATAYHPKSHHEFVGEACRMDEGHGRVLKLGYEEITRRRRQNLSGEELFIHEKMAYPGAKSFFVSMTRYPIMSGESLTKKTRVLAILAENCLMILLGSLAMEKKALPRNPGLHKLAMICQSTSHHLRPKGTPDPQWYGTNKMLPMLQNSALIWDLDTHGHVWTKPREQLREHWQRTGALTLTQAESNEFLLAAGIGVTSKRRSTIKRIYYAILQEHGHTCQTLYQDCLRRLAILWVAIIRQAEARDLVRGPHDGLYVLEDGGLDWSGISHIAQSIAPSDLRHLYSKHGCRRLFDRDSSQRFNRQVLYQCNWDRLKCKFSYPPLSLNAAKPDLFQGGLPMSFSSRQHQVHHPPGVYSRMVRVSQAKLHGYLSSEGIIQTNSSPNHTRITLKGPRRLLNIDDLMASVIQQLKLDIALCPSIIVEEEWWNRSSFTEPLRCQLQRRIQQVARGLLKTEWDQWPHLEELQEGWAEPWPDSDDIGLSLEEYPEPVPVASDVQRDDVQLDDRTKACLELLQVSRPEKVITNRESFFKAQSSHPVNEEVDQGTYFELWERDGTIPVTSIFQQKIKAATSSTGKAPVSSTLHSRAQRVPSQKAVTKSADTATRPESTQNTYVETCQRCGMTASRKGKHASHCQGKCKRCRDLDLPCDYNILPGGLKICICTNCKTAEAVCSGPVTHAHFVPDALVHVPCQRCQMQVPRASGHHKRCQGKCEACEKQRIPCDASMQTLRPPTCTNCKEQQLTCSGPITHSNLVQTREKTCLRCGTILKGDAKILKEHMRKCRGKCDNCEERGIACQMAGRRSCTNCIEQKVHCSSRTTHKHLVQKENDKTYSRCRTIPKGQAKNFHKHKGTCRGKCKDCDERGIPCDFPRNSPSCTNCIEQKLQCSGRITHRDLVRENEKTCSRCGAIPKCSVGNFGTHERQCRGKCKGCDAQGIPCVFSHGGKYTRACENCVEEKLQCSGRVTYADSVPES